MILRKANIKDIELLIRLRIDFLKEHEISLTQEVENTISLKFREYLNNNLPKNSFIGIIAEMDDKVVSAAYLAISEKPANPAFITGKVGTLLNVFTYPEYRRRGISTKVIKRIICEAEKAEVSFIELSATNDGKPLYEKVGFTVSSHTSMGMKLNNLIE